MFIEYSDLYCSDIVSIKAAMIERRKYARFMSTLCQMLITKDIGFIYTPSIFDLTIAFVSL